jgi:hypothetical protein
MKKLLFLTATISVFLFSCKNNLPPSPHFSIPPGRFYVVLDKNGNNLIHSLNDNLTVSYVLNGTTVTNRLNIYKIQKSATDTTQVTSKFNGFAFSDINYIPDGLGNSFIIVNSAFGNVRTFNLTLNGKDAGVIYLDFNAYETSYFADPNYTEKPTTAEALAADGNITTPYFTYNNVPVITDYNDDLNGNYIYVFNDHIHNPEYGVGNVFVLK